LAICKINLPSRQEMGTVFAVIVFSIFSWVMLAFFKRLNYWVLYLDITSLLEILAFGLVNALLESLFTLSLLLLIAIALPSRWFRDHFEAQGALTSMMFLGGLLMINTYQSMPTILPRLPFERSTIPAFCLFAATPAVNAMLIKSPRIATWFASVSRRFVPFIFIYVPLSIASMLFLMVQYIP